MVFSFVENCLWSPKCVQGWQKSIKVTLVWTCMGDNNYLQIQRQNLTFVDSHDWIWRPKCVRGLQRIHQCRLSLELHGTILTLCHTLIKYQQKEEKDSPAVTLKLLFPRWLLIADGATSLLLLTNAWSPKLALLTSSKEIYHSSDIKCSFCWEFSLWWV